MNTTTKARRKANCMAQLTLNLTRSERGNDWQQSKVLAWLKSMEYEITHNWDTLSARFTARLWRD